MLSHPLSIGSNVTGKKPTCACKGGALAPFDGKILKVISNRQEYWYYLDTGITVKDSWIATSVLPSI